MSEPFLGQLALVGFNFAPRGWMLCQGQLLSIAQNTALFSLLGIMYGGDGIQTFALPDLRGRSAIGFGQGNGLENYDQGAIGGEEKHTLIESEMPKHTHAVACSSGEASASSPSNQLLADGNIYAPTPAGTMNASMIGQSGGSQPHENRPPYLALNWVIAIEGIFPSRS